MSKKLPSLYAKSSPAVYRRKKFTVGAIHRRSSNKRQGDLLKSQFTVKIYE
jgi:hypothetical protein